MAEQQSARQPLSAEGLAILATPRYNQYNIPPAQNPSENPNYDELKAEQERNQEYRWSALLFNIKFWLIVVATCVAMIILAGILALVVWLVCIFVIHYTLPARGWLSPTELEQLGAVYGNFAKFAAPTALNHECLAGGILRNSSLDIAQITLCLARLLLLLLGL